MNITVAQTAGFCYGVRRAVELAEQTAQKGVCYMLGPIIHSKPTIERLQSMGVRLAACPEEIPKGATVLLRSHGEGEEVYRFLEKRGVHLVDTTCPNVARIHRLAAQAQQEGRKVVILGAPDHPEVKAIAGWCDAPLVFPDGAELYTYFCAHPEMCDQPVTLLSQTTCTREAWIFCVKNAKKVCTKLKIFDTICNATCARQSEAQRLAAACEAVIVIGGRESANTRRLYELCAALCPNTLWVERSDELKPSRLQGRASVAITAGASAPAWIIKEVFDKMSEENMEIEESFDDMLEKSFKTLNTGDKVTGIVTNITATDIYVDLGTKHAGYIPVSELTDDPTAKVEDLVHVGDEIETYVMRINDLEGVVTLSKKRLDSIKSWDDVELAKNERTTVEGTVTEENKGGVVVNVRGVRVFVPASQTGLSRDTPMSELVKQKVRLRITEVNRARRRVVGSIRAVAAAERAEKAAEVWAGIENGKHYQGTVKSLTSYGAFVDIGGVDGMVHISELSWSRIKHPSEVVNPGDEVDVYVISFDPEKKKISLGMKDPNLNPWENFTEQYHPNDKANVRVVKLMSFGAFAEIVPGVDGLIHISQIADHRIDKPGDVLSEGDHVDVKITEIDYDRKKVSLSIRALLEEMPPMIDEEEA